MTFAGPSLRDRLRKGTRGSQDAVERAYRRFDLSQADGLGRFLQAQSIWMRSFAQAAPELDVVLGEKLTDLDADLAELGLDAPDTRAQAPEVDDPLARGYVWHVQQIAIPMLTRGLALDGLGLRFLTSGRDSAGWRELCTILEAEAGYGPDADPILRAADMWLAQIETAQLAHLRG